MAAACEAAPSGSWGSREAKNQHSASGVRSKQAAPTPRALPRAGRETAREGRGDLRSSAGGSEGFGARQPPLAPLEPVGEARTASPRLRVAGQGLGPHWACGDGGGAAGGRERRALCPLPGPPVGAPARGQPFLELRPPRPSRPELQSREGRGECDTRSAEMSPSASFRPRGSQSRGRDGSPKAAARETSRSSPPPPTAAHPGVPPVHSLA